jgi:acetoin utilization protein AcuB
MSRIPTIKNVMRAFPYSLQATDSVDEARRLMAKHGIRHLPVLEGEKLVGLVTAHDLERAGSRRAKVAAIGELATAPVYTVDLDEPLDNVALHMATNRLGSALVVRHGKVVGIFTTTDALQVLAQHLRRDFPVGGDDAA